MSETIECNHPDPPQTCAWCEKQPVVVVNDRGACADHIDDVFSDTGAALGMLLMAATEAFGEKPQ